MKNPILISIATALLLFMAGCGQSNPAMGGPQAWIDAPLNGMQLPLAPYEIVAHAEDPAGISQFEFSVNQSVLGTTAGSAGSLSTVKQMWSPQAPGEYVISVRALGNSGAWGEVAAVKVVIYDAQFKTPATPTNTVPPPPTPTWTPLSNPIFVLIKNANCRFGPGQVFEVVNSGFAGDNVPIEGVSEDGTWWLVRLPNGDRCWMSGSTGNAAGNLGGVPVVQSPPTPVVQEPPTEQVLPPPQQAVGCYVMDPNQQLICTVPCPANAQPGGECVP